MTKKFPLRPLLSAALLWTLGVACGVDTLSPDPLDSGRAFDAGSADAGSTDAGAFDAGSADAGAFDAGSTDAGAFDAGSADAGSTDAGSTDAGSVDAGFVDAGAFDAGADAGAFDAGAFDAGADAGAFDAGSADVGTRCLVAADCAPSEYCFARGCTDPGVCQPRPAAPCASIPLDPPVCGCNGVTYSTPCQARRARQRIRSVGACP
jgi:hypothetical protein